ncbi:hypothetical protein AB9P05_12825 [Roseivirga sp. BDSF3-8]|uniref:hypothetical protein n=1 Tax=Roseivirga sp. BDSF3-8 TaxID=3241598 RepID=UPI003532622E
MTVSRPKPSTLFALGVFILLTLTAAIYLAIPLITGHSMETWRLLLVLLLAPTGLGLLTRVVFSYKKVEVRKDRFVVTHPFRPGGNWQEKYREVDFWKEETVKTGGTQYKELLAVFISGKKLRVSMQEYTEYAKVVRALERHAGKKKRS